MHICSSCKLELPNSRFRKRNGRPSNVVSKCKDCSSKYEKERRSAKPDMYKNITLKKTYGITLEEYNAILLKQHGVCAICGKPEIATRGGKLLALSVDHDHATNQIRGLLCESCNIGLGNFKEDVPTLLSAIKYVEFWSEQTKK